MKSIYLVLLLISGSVFGADSAPLKRALESTFAWVRANGASEEKLWKGFLRYDDLLKETAKARPDVDELKLILNKWRKNKVGLEDPRFVVSQQALRAYIQQVEIEAIADKKATCDEWANRMLSTPADQGAALEVGKAAGWYAKVCGNNFVPEKLRMYYGRPNLRFDVSAKTIAMGLEGMEIHNQQFVANVVDGVSTRGWVNTNGKLSARPVNARYVGQGLVQVDLAATICSPRIDGQKGSVSIVTSSYGTANALAQIGLDNSGLRVVASNGWAALNTQIQDVYAPSRIVNWFAWRVAERKQGEASWTASQMAATKLRDELVSQLSGKLNEAEKQYFAPLKQTIRFEGAYPERMDFGSTANQLSLAVTERNQFQLAAATEPPALLGKHDLGFSVHESFASNYLAPYMGGKQEWDTSLYDVHKLLTTDEPTELRVHDNTPRWYFWVDEYRPVTSDFSADNIRFRFYGTSIGRVWKGVEEKNVRPFRATVDFTPEIDTLRNQARLRRKGVVVVTYTDGAESTALDQSLLDMLTRKLNAFFPELFEFGGLQIPKGSGWEKLRRFQLKEFKAASGWMALGFELH